MKHPDMVQVCTNYFVRKLKIDLDNLDNEKEFSIIYDNCSELMLKLNVELTKDTYAMFVLGFFNSLSKIKAGIFLTATCAIPLLILYRGIYNHYSFKNKKRNSIEYITYNAISDKIQFLCMSALVYVFFFPS